MRAHLRVSAFEALLLVLVRAISCIATQATSSSTTSILNPTFASPTICPYRSINYITQTLPQQCLTSSWTSRSPSQSLANTTSPTLLSYTTSPTSFTAPSSSLGDSPQPQTLTVSSEASASLSLSSTSETIPASSTLKSPSTSVKGAEGPEIPQDKPQDKPQETDADSPLDNANFLSFEDWKRQNLEKAGQSAENFVAREGASAGEQRRRPGAIHNALDSLGEDSEIDIDFGGFVNPQRLDDPTPQHPSKEHEKGGTGASSALERKRADSVGERKRSRDAGTTRKERYNYASFDCAAGILKTNPECKGSTSVLVENKDSYMLNVCSVKNKFLIVELCEDILIDTLVLANFEFFSSMFRTFRVSISDRYPVKMDKWKDLGVYEARNSRDAQAFLVENPLIWARYLRIEFLTHFGNEYYCPISLLRIHGTTMMQEFNREVKESRPEDDSEGYEESSHVVAGDSPSSAIEGGQTTTSGVSMVQTSLRVPVEVETALESLTPSALSTPQSSPSAPNAEWSVAQSCATISPEEIFIAGGVRESHCTISPNGEPKSGATVATPTPSSSGSTQLTPFIARTDMEKDVATDLQLSQSRNASNLSETAQTTVPTGSSSGNQNVSQFSTKTSNSTVPSPSRSQTSSTQPASPNPTTQESFFKSVHKRLQQLEANSTLSLQYIEEQSRILRDAFSKVEKRQLSKTSSFLESLNTTVLTELREFRLQYDQIWQSTVLELSSQREQSQHEVFALSKRINFLADEIVFQKRVAVLQFTLILLCLGFLIFPRHPSSSTYFELPPLVQNALNKSSTSLSRSTHFDSPPRSPLSTRASSRYGLFRTWTHRRCPSEDSDQRECSKSPTIERSPPTPESMRSLRGEGDSSSVDGSGSPSDGSPVRRPDRPPKAHGDPPPLQDVTRDREDHLETSPLTPKANATWREDTRSL